MSYTGHNAARDAYAKQLDYASLGFRCGLEIHQQLDTRKLFSPCPSDVIDPDAVAARTVGRYERMLRATGGELGDVDVAALAEAKRGRRFRYLAIEDLTSLVELDEEPPHPMSDDALDVALTFAGLLDSRPADEVHVMRKTVIDGSNTSGFQRTALIATGGRLDVEGGDVGIWTIAVEEDSARKLEENDGVVTYTLDRLGIPLIEVATGPDIKDPQHAKRAAARLGALLRATGRVKRGLGTIRQDLNVSIGVGDRVEIKGCQDLRLVPEVIDKEVRRQLWLHHIREELNRRSFTAESVGEICDVTDHFYATQAKLLKGAIKNGGKVMALPLKQWAGLIRDAAADGIEGPRIGREFADHARVAAGVKGIFHSDELPAYGIEPMEVEAIHNTLALGPHDAFVLCAEKEPVARRALQAVAARAVQALDGCICEVRVAQEDGTSRYMRPLPGAARMYPETDVPPVRITKQRWQRIRDNLPLRPEEKVAALVRMGLSPDQAQQLVADGEGAVFERLVADGADAALAARVLLQLLPPLAHHDAVEARLGELFVHLAKGAFAKEAIPAILSALDEEPGVAMTDAIASAIGGGDVDLDGVIARVVEERRDFIKQRGQASLGPLMGPVMSELRGKVDGQLISERLKVAIAQVLED
jgi:glutamyl-tRNA(Gln) amidotransferase subunit E